MTLASYTHSILLGNSRRNDKIFVLGSPNGQIVVFKQNQTYDIFKMRKRVPNFGSYLLMPYHTFLFLSSQGTSRNATPLNRSLYKLPQN